MRVYLVILDETAEARVALRFAARRAASTGGAVHVIALVPPQGFSAFGAIQATIEAEARERTEAVAREAASQVHADIGASATIVVRMGEGRKVVQEYLADHPEVAALVLSAAPQGNPGPMVSHFTASAGMLPCPVFVVPGGLSDEAVDRLS